VDIGFVIAAFTATAAGSAAGNLVDPLIWILAGAVGVTERMRPWKYLVASIFAAVKTGLIAVNTSLWREDPILLSAPWFDLVGKFLGAFVAFLAIAFLVAAIAQQIEKRRRETPGE
jgi:hypothetical protein